MQCTKKMKSPQQSQSAADRAGGGAKCLSYAADMYNGLLTGDVTMVLTAARMDCHKIPCVILIYEKDDSEF